MVEQVESLCAQLQLQGVMRERERTADTGIDRIDRLAASGVSTDNGRLDNRTVRACTSIAAIHRTCDDVEWKAARQRCDTADLNLERSHVFAAQDEAMALVVDRRAVLFVLCEVGIVGVLRGGVGIDVVE